MTLLLSNRRYETAVLVFLMSSNLYNRRFCLRNFVCSLVESNVVSSRTDLSKVAKLLEMSLDVPNIEDDVAEIQSTLLKS